MKASLLWIGLPTVLVIGLIGSYLLSPGQNDEFAQCIKDSGATFYGAFWCPHCQDQKKLFGKSASLLPYIECSTTDGQNQLPVCKEKSIESYPTWIFKDGSVKSQVLSLSELSEITSCPLSTTTVAVN